MSTIPDFTNVTGELVSALETGMSAYLNSTPGQLNSSVLDYPPVSLEGNSPVISLHDDGAEPVDGTWKRWRVHYRLTHFINRETGADGAETLLRQMRKAALTTLQNNVQGTYHQALVVSAKSAPAFELIDGVNYRLEEFFFFVRVDCYT